MSDFNRDRWGRPLIIVPGETKPIPYTRFSSHGQCLEDRFGLEKWKIRTAGKGLALRSDLYAQVAACPADDSRRLDSLMEAALEAGGSSVGAGLGTALHEFTQNFDLGTSTLADIPEPWRWDVEAYANTLEAFDLTVDRELIEVSLVNDHLRLAGTADRFYERADGTLVCADIKTGKQIGDNPLAYIVQLAAYANSVRYDIETGRRTEVGTVDHDFGILVHLPSGKAECTLYQVDLREGLILAELATQVRRRQKHKGLVSRIEPTDGTFEAPVAGSEPDSPDGSDPAPNLREWLATRIDIIRSHDEAFNNLRTLWPADIPTLKQSDEHTAVELETISRLLDNIEALYGLPFGDPKPDTTEVKELEAPVKIVEATITIDEGRDADPDNLTILRKELGALDDTRKAWVQAQTKRANSAGYPISLKQKPTSRRYHIAQFLIAASTYHDDGDDILKAVLQHFSDTPLDTAKAIGYVLGTMSTENAIRAAALMLAIEAGDIQLSFYGDGTPTLTGPVASYLPNPTQT